MKKAMLVGVTIFPEGGNPTRYANDLILDKALPPIKRDWKKLSEEYTRWGGDQEMKVAVAQRSEGGVIRENHTRYTYLIYRDFKGKQHFYVGNNTVHFYPPRGINPPALTGVGGHARFNAWLEEHPKAYEEWNASIKAELKKHPSCKCVFSGDSGHMNLQECLCKGKTLVEAKAKAKNLFKDQKII
jgi:hypothetical protein